MKGMFRLDSNLDMFGLDSNLDTFGLDCNLDMFTFYSDWDMKGWGCWAGRCNPSAKQASVMQGWVGCQAG